MTFLADIGAALLVGIGEKRQRQVAYRVSFLSRRIPFRPHCRLLPCLLDSFPRAPITALQLSLALFDLVAQPVVEIGLLVDGALRVLVLLAQLDRALQILKH